MDRFTRTREHYLRGARLKEVQGLRQTPTSTAPSPTPAEDVIFDFDFNNSRLDLTLGTDRSLPEKTSSATAQPRDAIGHEIGIAISDESDVLQRGRLRISRPCTITIESQNEQVGNQQGGTTMIPPIPNEVRLKFSTRNDEESKKPSCSIYSREWRRRVTTEITPPEQTTSGTRAKNTENEPGDSKSASGIQGANDTSVSDKFPSLEEEMSVFTQGQTRKASSRSAQTESFDRGLLEDKKKRSSGFKKIFSSFKTSRKDKTTKYTAEDNETVVSKACQPSSTAPALLPPVPPITPSSSMLTDEEARPAGGRLGEAFRARVAEKQGQAQNLTRSSTDSLPGSLRGGGNAASAGPNHVFSEDDGHFSDNPHVRVGPRIRPLRLQRHHPDCPYRQGGCPCHNTNLPGRESGRPHPRPPRRNPVGGDYTPPPGTPRSGSQVHIEFFPTRAARLPQRGSRHDREPRDPRNPRSRQRPQRHGRSSRDRGRRGGPREPQGQDHSQPASNNARTRQPVVPTEGPHPANPTAQTAPNLWASQNVLPGRRESQPLTSNFKNSQASLSLRQKPKAGLSRPFGSAIAGSSRSFISRPISRSIRITSGESDAENEPNPRESAPSLPKQDADVPHAMPVRITMADGRATTMDEYRALKEKRAGKKRAPSLASSTKEHALPRPSTSVPRTAQPPASKSMSAMDLLRQGGGSCEVNTTGIQLRPNVRRASLKVHAAAKSFLDSVERRPSEESHLERGVSAKHATRQKAPPVMRTQRQAASLLEKFIGEKLTRENYITKSTLPKTVPARKTSAKLTPTKPAAEPATESPVIPSAQSAIANEIANVNESREAFNSFIQEEIDAIEAEIRRLNATQPDTIAAPASAPSRNRSSSQNSSGPSASSRTSGRSISFSSITATVGRAASQDTYRLPAVTTVSSSLSARPILRLRPTPAANAVATTPLEPRALTNPRIPLFQANRRPFADFPPDSSSITPDPLPLYTPLPIASSEPARSSSPTPSAQSTALPPAISINRTLGQTPSAVPGERPLPTVVQAGNTMSDEDTDAEPGWSFAHLGSR